MAPHSGWGRGGGRGKGGRVSFGSLAPGAKLAKAAANPQGVGSADPTASAAPPAPAGVAVNAAYHTQVLEALRVVHENWPGIQQESLLPADVGLLAPYSPATYSKQWAGAHGPLAYQCAINFCWQNSLVSPLPAVPIDKDRMVELADQVVPGLLKYPLVILAT